MLLLTRTDVGVPAFMASTMIAGIGYGLSFSLVADVAVSAVPPERAGAAGAIAETSNESGNALGMTLLAALSGRNTNAAALKGHAGAAASSPTPRLRL